MQYEIQKTYSKKVKKNTKFDIDDVVMISGEDKYIFKITAIKLLETGKIYYLDFEDDRTLQEDLTLISKANKND